MPQRFGRGRPDVVSRSPVRYVVGVNLTDGVRLLGAPWRAVARWLGLGASAERWLGYVAGLAAVALASVLIGLVRAQGRIANISMLYLIAIIVTAVTFGRGPAVAA